MFFGTFIVFDTMNACNESNNVLVVMLLQDILCKAGCLQRLSALLKSYKLAVTIGHQIDPDCLQCALNAVNNLAMNVNNQALLAVSSSAAVDYFSAYRYK